MNTPTQQIPNGWVCPRCKAVMAPNVLTCIYCKRETKNEESTGGQECLMESK